MKNKSMMLTISFLLSAFSYTNAQRCGTTEYYHMRKQNNVLLQSHFDQVEKLSQDWIQRQAPVQIPAIAGFVPVGNPQQDIPGYAEAKRNLVKVRNEKNEVTTQNRSELEKIRNQKRKNNEFLTKKGGLK